jgi:D-sedoheptulose 7-phosphate isomerase
MIPGDFSSRMLRMGQERIDRTVQEHRTVIGEIFSTQAAELAGFSSKVVSVFHQGGRLLVLGSGPLGAIADLTANLFLHRLSLERPLLPALSLGHDTVLATALARDGRGHEFFARQLQAAATRQDLVLVFGGPRREEALEEALTVAGELDCGTAAVLQGKGELLREPPDFLFRLETESVPRAVEAALLFSHLLVELVEGELFGI